MKLHEMKYTVGARQSTKRLGRGQGSGQGKTAGKGHKGQNARSGGGVAIGFEGGQTPFFKRMPKRGFHNFTRVEYSVVNLVDLNKFDDGATVTSELLEEMRLVPKNNSGVKILGKGKLEKKLTVKCDAISKTAKEAIEKAGGSVEVVNA